MRMTYQQAEDMVRQTLSPKRFQHTMNVKKLAVRMAQHYGVDTEKAALAAILHDSAKELPRTELLQIMQDNAIIKKGTVEIISNDIIAAFNFNRKCSILSLR